MQYESRATRRAQARLETRMQELGAKRVGEFLARTPLDHHPHAAPLRRDAEVFVEAVAQQQAAIRVGAEPDVDGLFLALSPQQWVELTYATLLQCTLEELTIGAPLVKRAARLVEAAVLHLAYDEIPREDRNRIERYNKPGADRSRAARRHPAYIKVRGPLQRKSTTGKQLPLRAAVNRIGVELLQTLGRISTLFTTICDRRRDTWRVKLTPRARDVFVALRVGELGRAQQFLPMATIPLDWVLADVPDRTGATSRERLFAAFDDVLNTGELAWKE